MTIENTPLELARSLLKNLTEDDKRSIALGTYDWEIEDMAQLLDAWVEALEIEGRLGAESKATTLARTHKHIRGIAKALTFYV